MKTKTILTIVGMAALLPLTAHSSLVAYWAFDGATATDRLQESLGNTALDAAEAGGTSAWNTRSGFGGVLANGGNSPYLAITNGPDLDFGTGDFSLSIWTYRTSGVGSTAGIMDALSSTTTSGFQSLYTSGNDVIFRIDGDNGNHVVASTVSGGHVALSTWQNIIATVDRSNDLLKIYIDGVEDTGGGIDISGVTGNILPDQALWISTLNITTAPARGRLDDMGLFDHVLLPTEIAAINAGSGTPLGDITFVPEPSSVALLASICLFGLLRHRRD